MAISDDFVLKIWISFICSCFSSVKREKRFKILIKQNFIFITSAEKALTFFCNSKERVWSPLTDVHLQCAHLVWGHVLLYCAFPPKRGLLLLLWVLPQFMVIYDNHLPLGKISVLAFQLFFPLIQMTQKKRNLLNYILLCFIKLFIISCMVCSPLPGWCDFPIQIVIVIIMCFSITRYAVSKYKALADRT